MNKKSALTAIEKYLKEQIESVLNQTYKNIRILISDDCSKDRTQEILQEYEKKDDRIKIFLHDRNLGSNKNFEFLLRQVESKFYMLSDQDDVWLPEKIEKTIQKQKETGADLVFGDLEVVNEKLETIYPSFGDFMLLNRKINKYIGSYKVNYLYNVVTGCTILSTKEFIEKILPFPTDSKYLIHDHWIGIVIALNGKLAYMPEKYIKYRQHGNNQVGTNKISHNFQELEQVRELFINVKLGVFGTYVKHKEIFPEKLQKQNEKAYKYFQDIQKKKNFNFKGWGIFHELYKTETRDINKAVRNNPEKFPSGYFFTLKPSEKQYVVENFHRMENLKKSTVEPKAFTEKGLYMLATILKSPRATQTTIAIIDSFVKLRELIRNVDAIQNEPDLIKQKGIVKRTSQLLSDLLIDDADTTEMESTIELNLMAVKLKHTVKRIKNNNKTEDKSEI